MDFSEFEKKIGYTFKNKDLLYEALSHSSYANEYRHGRSSNERLEFLGDSAISVAAIRRMPPSSPPPRSSASSPA